METTTNLKPQTKPLQAGSLICYMTVCSILGYKEQGHLRKAAFAEGMASGYGGALFVTLHFLIISHNGASFLL